MARTDHQPQETIAARPDRTLEERRATCGGTLAFVLAYETGTTPLTVMFDDPDKEPITLACEEGEMPVARPLQVFEGKPCVRWAVDAALEAQVPNVCILYAPELRESILEALEGVDASRVLFVEFDCEMAKRIAREAAYFELFDLSAYVLKIAREQALAFEAESVLFLPADMVRFTADHIFELCADMNAHGGAVKLDAVASWISWFRRAPYLVSTYFLEELAVSKLMAVASFARDGQSRPIPQLKVRDHAFGEEKLGANPVVPESIASFTQGCTMTALQAVRLAKWAKQHPDEEPHSPNQPLSLLGPVAPKPLSDADRLLFDSATQVIDKLADAWPAEEQGDLAWATEFGARNRRDFPLLEDRAHKDKLAYLDSAATAQRLAAVVQAQNDFDLHENANIYRGSYPLSAQATFTYNDARARVEAFIGAERRETVFTANTSSALALVAQAWGEHHIHAGDTIVTTVAEHHSNMISFVMLAERKGARIVYVPLLPDGRIDQKAYEDALALHPKLVCVAHVGNVLGIEAPVEQMAEAAHAVGARFVLDAAQSFPHMKIDVRACKADWVAFSGHKAYAPMGIGGLWISPEVFSEMDPVVGGGGTVSHVSVEGYYLRPKIIQYELGTPPISQAVGLASAIDYLDGLGMENVARHAATLTRYATCGLGLIEGVSVLGDHSKPDGQHGLISFAVAGVNPEYLAAFLGQLDVAIRAGSHCAIPLQASMGSLGVGRISMGVYTLPDEIEAALVAIEVCRRLYA